MNCPDTASLRASAARLRALALDEWLTEIVAAVDRMIGYVDAFEKSPSPELLLAALDAQMRLNVLALALAKTINRNAN